MTTTPLEMRVQNKPDIVRDLKANARMAATLMALLIIYSLASSFLFWLFEHSAWHEAAQENDKVTELTYLRALYFTGINITTVGFGDVFPRTGLGEIIAVTNGLCGLVLFGFFVATTTLALQPGNTATIDTTGQSRSQDSEPDVDLVEAVRRLITIAPETIEQAPIHIVNGRGADRTRAVIHIFVELGPDEPSAEGKRPDV